jgi:hypothetical protein
VRPDRLRHRWVGFLLGAALAVGPLAGCGSGLDGQPGRSGAAPAGPLSQVSHVHGLDGPGQAAPVGPRQDTMGFTVTGPDTFLGSGHPAPGAGGPPHLGLIESTDAGASWATRSLSGQADFHGLVYAHNAVYGHDATSGVLRVSADMQAWDDRARVAAADIAVSPADPDTLLATTEQGVARSTDGGRTFASGDGQVQVLLAWPAAATLYGVDPGGTLSLSADAGATWRAVGPVPGGQPQAFAAVDERRLLAATSTGLYESRDGGAAFTQLLALSE